MAQIRKHIEIRGIVQGVGFRPFVHKAALQNRLSGWVSNTSNGAELELQGREEDIASLLHTLKTDPPGLAYIESVEEEARELLPEEAGFTIVPSKTLAVRNTLLSPDVCICEDCLRELRDPADRRYRYPFINCTNCGPRFSIIRDVPYDRPKTTMSTFPMCPECGREYTDVTDRRYHAQPNCCPVCGPQLSYTGQEELSNCPDGQDLNGYALRRAAALLKNGGILAVKGLGGFHLACEYNREETLQTLRERKHRDGKPFALMCRDIGSAKELAFISPAEEKLLQSRARPIVLLKKRPCTVSDTISRNGFVGIMLPYTPLHYLLMDEGFDTLVMTSANLSHQPILHTNEDALRGLRGIADGFLMHDRDIHTRCDDSVLWCHEGEPYFARRSRGYAPLPILLRSEREQELLACGAEQKASFALYRESHLFQSQHIGDLKNLETLEHYENEITHFQTLFDIKPAALVCDMHPDYLSTRYAEQRSQKEGLPLIRVQHHHAHMAACMADNSLKEKCIGIIWDGTGYGTDGTIWGSEFLTGDLRSFERQGSILPIALPGGDRCTSQTERVAVSLAESAGITYPCALEKASLTMLRNHLNAPLSSGMGRLFDGVSAFLGICTEATYEGEGAINLEYAASEYMRINGAGLSPSSPHYTVSILKEDVLRFDWRDMLREMERDLRQGIESGECAYKFLGTLLMMAVEMCEKIKKSTGLTDVVLSGGTFQNMLLLSALPPALKSRGFTVYTHHRISPNDEGISAGQAAIALHRIQEDL